MSSLFGYTFLYNKGWIVAKLMKCNVCKGTVASTADICPHCGAKNELVNEVVIDWGILNAKLEIKNWKIIAIMLLITIVGVKYIINTQQEKTAKLQEEKIAKQESIKIAQSWYKGASLHKATIEEWNRASQQNKLATMGDIEISYDGFTRKYIKDEWASNNNYETIKRGSNKLLTCVEESILKDNLPSNYLIENIALSCLVADSSSFKNVKELKEFLLAFNIDGTSALYTSNGNIQWHSLENIIDGIKEIKGGNVDGAWAYTQIYVEKQLKSPRSADFPFGGSRGVAYLGNNLYSFNSYVDATNSFGAEIRTSFSGTIRKTSGGWTIETFSMR